MASLIYLKKKYLVSAISIRWLYDIRSVIRFPLRAIYTKFLRSSLMVFVTEKCYLNVLENHKILQAAVLHERFLSRNIESNIESNNSIDSNKPLRLVTLGTVSSEKNPVSFVRDLNSIKDDKLIYEYRIYGKSMDPIGVELRELVNRNANIHYCDEYISNNDYDDLLEWADFVVIPYSENYTKYMTSGVMWDCFERRKLIICPDCELFRHYIDLYKIGFIYTCETLGPLIVTLSANKNSIKQELQLNYERLYEANSYSNALSRFTSTMNLCIKSF